MSERRFNAWFLIALAGSGFVLVFEAITFDLLSFPVIITIAFFSSLVGVAGWDELKLTQDETEEEYEND